MVLPSQANQVRVPAWSVTMVSCGVPEPGAALGTAWWVTAALSSMSRTACPAGSTLTRLLIRCAVEPSRRAVRGRDGCVPGQRREDLDHLGSGVRRRIGRHGGDLRVGEVAEADQVWSRRWRHGYDQPPSL
jgi:hypothetical protein